MNLYSISPQHLPISRDIIRRHEQRTLHEYIRTACMQTGQEFTLSSGRRSKTYFDLKHLLFDGEHGSQAADELLGIIAREFPNVRVIGGEEVGGAASIAQIFGAAQRAHYPITSAFLVYPRREDEVLVAANVPSPGTDVILVDDAATTGRAMGIARGFIPECNILAGAVIVDRSFGEAERNLGFPIISVFSEADFVE